MRPSRLMVNPSPANSAYAAYLSLGAVSPGPRFDHPRPCGDGGGFRAPGSTAVPFLEALSVPRYRRAAM